MKHKMWRLEYYTHCTNTFNKDKTAENWSFIPGSQLITKLSLISIIVNSISKLTEHITGHFN